MATRSTIAVVHQNGSISQIYCHWDGYLKHNGRILVNHYNSLNKVEELINLGSLSLLAENIYPDPNPNKPHSFEHPQDNVCIFYGRDRGEACVEPNTFKNLHEYKLLLQKEEFNYIFCNGEWYCKEYDEDEFESIKGKVSAKTL